MLNMELWDCFKTLVVSLKLQWMKCLFENNLYIVKHEGQWMMKWLSLECPVVKLEINNETHTDLKVIRFWLQDTRDLAQLIIRIKNKDPQFWS